ncbi:MAG: hypothetical protein A2Z98_12480 [Spirochaetes bacterium GWB1_27_13]|nr:MAG: hypothetical protein A2Z98_12480 [Spirochaetes bacterium GWB1_27_13]
MTQRQYENWWLNKKCHVVGSTEKKYKKVIKIEVIKNKNHNFVVLHYEDKTTEHVGNENRLPTKWEVEVQK